eukprot:scaffold1958_cov253-Pinguiococcus_pyrenoidosus.AAC.15
MPFDVTDVGLDVSDVVLTTAASGQLEVMASVTAGRMLFYAVMADTVQLTGELPLPHSVSRFQPLTLGDGFVTGSMDGELGLYHNLGSASAPNAVLTVREDENLQMAQPVSAHQSLITGIDVQPGGTLAASVADQGGFHLCMAGEKKKHRSDDSTPGSLAVVDLAQMAVVRQYSYADPVSLSAVIFRAVDGCVLTAGMDGDGRRETDLLTCFITTRHVSKGSTEALGHSPGVKHGCGHVSASFFGGRVHEPFTASNGPTSGVRGHCRRGGTVPSYRRSRVASLDLRSDAAKVLSSAQAHDGDVLCVRHHPVTPAYCFTGGIDGSVVLLEGTAAGSYNVEVLGTCGEGIHALDVNAASNAVVGATRGERFVLVQGLEQTSAGSKYSFQAAATASALAPSTLPDIDMSMIPS